MTSKPQGELREQLADIQHQQWSGWMEYMFSKCDPKEDENGNRVFVIPAWAVERWIRQLNTDYNSLTEKEKESDRIEADKYIPIIEAHTARVVNDVRKEGITGETSDGYHTFDELYEYRKIYNASLFNEWYSQGKFDVHKSHKHSDGELCFGGDWFIVVAELPNGQISNHYENKDWGLFKIPEKEVPNEYDGHTPKEALDRLILLIKESEEK